MNEAPQILKLLADDIRWDLVSNLTRSDFRVGELVDRVGRPQNLVSYHLGRLRDGGLVREHRSSADGRDIYYSLDLTALDERFRQSGEALHPALACPPGEAVRASAENPARVLFLCTHNSARSQMAEALLRAAMGERVVVASAGSEPSTVQPLALEVMAERGIDIRAQQSKHMSQVTGQRWDWVITVCDKVREVCPVFPHDVNTAHWSIRDPVAMRGSESERIAAFRAAAAAIERRVEYLHWVL